MDNTKQPRLASSSVSHTVPARVEIVNETSNARRRVADGTAGRYGNEIPTDEDSDGGLLLLWRTLHRHKLAILFWTLGGAVLGVAIGIPMQPVFRARTSLEVLNLNEDFMNMKQSSPVTTSDNSYETSEEETQANLLESEALLDRVLARLDPGRPRNPPLPPMATSGVRKWLHRREPVPMTEREKQLAKLSLSLKIRPLVRTRILEVTAESTNSGLAADFVNTLVAEFIQQNVDANLNRSQSTSDWLRREIDGARASLAKAEDALQKYASDSGLIFTDENTSIDTEKLQQVQQQLSVATADRITKQAHLELARNSPPESLSDILSDERFTDISAKMLDLQRQIASMSQIFAPGYSKLQQAQAELATLQTTFQAERDDILRHIENDYTEAKNKEQMLAGTYDSQVRDVTGLGGKLTQYNILKREADSSRQLYDMMLQQTKQASIAAAMRASNVRIVDPAVAPAIAVFPNFKLNAALGLLTGLFLSVGIVMLRERADRTLQQPGEVKLWTDLPELGSIPSGTRNRSLGPRNAFELTSTPQSPSVAAEAFRSTLTSLLFMGDGGARLRVIAFTSASPQEGKTSVVSNLALATAEIRRRVLIIDADLRRPRMHDIFNVPNERGLANVLREELSPECLSGLVQETRIPGLHVLPAGPPTQAAAHLLYSPNLAAVLERFRPDYDLIFVDTPPRLQMTDARVTARLADAVVLVARSGKTSRDALIAARDRLCEDRIEVLGTILNDWNQRKAVDSYYGYSAVEAYKVEA